MPLPERRGNVSYSFRGFPGVLGLSPPTPLLDGGPLQCPEIMKNVGRHINADRPGNGRQGPVVQPCAKHPRHAGAYPPPLRLHRYKKAPGWHHVRPEFDLGALRLSRRDRCIEPDRG